MSEFTVITAVCHGETGRTTLSARELEELRSWIEHDLRLEAKYISTVGGLPDSPQHSELGKRSFSPTSILKVFKVLFALLVLEAVALAFTVTRVEAILAHTLNTVADRQKTTILEAKPK